MLKMKLTSYQNSIRLLASFAFLMLSACGTPGGVIHSGTHTQKHIKITGGSTSGQLSIERLELTDQNGRNSFNVVKGKKITPLATIKFSGRGVLTGQWLVDGKIIEQINVNLSHGSLLNLRLKPSTRIPAFIPGSHKLQLKINQPAVNFKYPVLKFFVTAK